MGGSEWRDTERLPLSAYVICKDEEASIGACLDSLAVCDDIVVVDSGSSDGTVAVVEGRAARGLPVRLFHQDWLGFARQKQFALDRTTQPWCLNLDADERLDARLKSALPALLAADEAVGGFRLRILRADLAARRHLGWIRAKPTLRLVRRGRARYDARSLVHEHVHVDGVVRDAPEGCILHDHEPSYEAQIRKEIHYAGLKARERVRSGRRPSRLKLVFSPPLYFLRSYLLHRWFLAGWSGFMHSAMLAVYSFSAEAIHFERAGRPDGGERGP